MLSINTARDFLAPLIICILAQSSEAGVISKTVPQQAERIASLVATLEVWLDDHADFAPRDSSPEIMVIDAVSAAKLSGNTSRDHRLTRGLYDPQTATIYLIEPWDTSKPSDVGVLLHELVHHRQVKHHYYCPGAQEEAAYRLQDDWLRERGARADVNWIAVVLEAGCAPRDIHPD